MQEMSVVEKLEEAFAKFPMRDYDNIYTKYLKEVLEVEFASFKKACVIVPRKQLLSLRDACMKADEKLGIESLATHILIDLLDGKYSKEV